MADFDADGAAEVVLADESTLSLRELDGTVVWQIPASDPTGLAGCVATDLDADGDYEVLYNDHDGAYVFEGATGALLLTLTSRTSMTTFEYPIPADLDGDGTAEILVVAAGGGKGPLITAWEHDGDGWQAFTEAWGIHDYAPGRQEDDTSIPADSDYAWETPSRLRATEVAPSHGVSDLVPTLTDLCVADCAYGPVALAFTVENRGVGDVEAGVEAVVYADDGGSRREVARVVLPAIAASTRLDGVRVDLAAADIGAYAMVVVVDEGDRGGAVDECNEDNNEDVLLTGC